jgi:hypothetical protein
MVFRKRELSDSMKIVIAGKGEDSDLDDSGTRRRAGQSASGSVRISADEKMVYELVDGKRTVGDVVEASRLSEFDTNKALYDLVNHDLIDEVREIQQPLTLEELEPEHPAPPEPEAVPFPLVAALVVAAILSLATSWKNPLNYTSPSSASRSILDETKKAVSFQRIRTLGEAVDAYYLVNSSLPDDLPQLVPHFIPRDILEDPWGNPYKYLQPPGKFLVIGFTPDGRADTDLFFAQNIETSAPSSRPTQPSGGIILVE